MQHVSDFSGSMIFMILYMGESQPKCCVILQILAISGRFLVNFSQMQHIGDALKINSLHELLHERETTKLLRNVTDFDSFLTYAAGKRRWISFLHKSLLEREPAGSLRNISDFDNSVTIS